MLNLGIVKTRRSLLTKPFHSCHSTMKIVSIEPVVIGRVELLLCCKQPHAFEVSIQLRRTIRRSVNVEIISIFTDGLFLQNVDKRDCVRLLQVMSGCKVLHRSCNR